MGAGVGVRSGDADVSGGMDGTRGPAESQSASGSATAGTDTSVGRPGVGSQALSNDAGRSGADRPIRRPEGVGEGEQTGDLQPAGQARVDGQDLRSGGREQEGLPPKTEPAEAGLVRRDNPAGLGERGSSDISHGSVSHVGYEMV